MKKYDLTIKNHDEVNMSNWQITHTVNVLTTVNNKFDILNKLNSYINNGVDKSNIFIFDKSFSFNTNYKTYFSKKESEFEYLDIVKICHMGKIISMQPSEQIMEINILCDFYRAINSVINNNFKRRFRAMYLHEGYAVLCKQGLKKALEKLYESARTQIFDIYERRLKPDYDEMNKILQEVEKCYEKDLVKIVKKYTKWNEECAHKFEHYFNSCARPVAGIYDKETHRFEIINADQMYKNGEESEKQIKLNSISKNSPAILVFSVVGVMGAVMAYLAYRNHKVDSIIDDEDMLDVPDNRMEAMKNIIGNEDNLLVEHNNTKKVDAKILSLATDTYAKVEMVTDTNRVTVDYVIHTEKIVE